MDFALLMILRLYNRDTAVRVKNELANLTEGERSETTSWFERFSNSRLARVLTKVRANRKGQPSPRNEQLDTSEWIEMELVAQDDEPRRW